MYADILHAQNLPRIYDFYASLSFLVKREKTEEKLIDWNQIVEKISKNDCRQSFKTLFSHFYPLLLANFTKSGLSKEISAELSQECMMKVWNSIKTFDSSKASVSTWIYIIARNTKFDYLRKLKNDPINPSSSHLYETLDEVESEALEVELLIDLNILKNYLELLPAEQKIVLEQMYLEGLSHQEISDNLKLPLGTVKSRIRLALVNVRKMMEGKIQ